MAVRRPAKPIIPDEYIGTNQIALDAITETRLDPDSLSNATSMAWDDEVKAAQFTAEINKKYFCDTISGSFTVYLPSDPNIGDEVWFHDITGNWFTANMTINGNGNTIMKNTTFAADIQNDTVICVFAGNDWRVVI
jgi:hypothetical protein